MVTDERLNFWYVTYIRTLHKIVQDQSFIKWHHIKGGFTIERCKNSDVSKEINLYLS